jgi:hypothetical protein
LGKLWKKESWGEGKKKCDGGEKIVIVNKIIFEWNGEKK